MKTLETELGTKFTASQKRKFTDALSAAWDVGNGRDRSATGPVGEVTRTAPTLDFNKTAKTFFEKILKVDVGGQFKDNKNNFRATIQNALDTGDMQSAIKALEEKLLGKRTTGKLDANSALRDKLDYVVRDNIYRAQSFSRSLTMEQEGIARVEFVAIVDQRTSNLCLALNGKSVELKTVNTYIQNFLADDPERAGFWADRKNPSDMAMSQLGFDKMTGDEILAHLGHQAPPFHIKCRTTVVASVNIVARTVKEAENIAKLQFGVTADYTKGSLEMANYMNAGFRSLKEIGQRLPAKATIGVAEMVKRDSRAKDALAAYDEKTDELLMNEENYIPSNPEFYMNYLKDKNFYSTNNPFHTINHEMGHKANFENNAELFYKFKDMTITEPKVINLLNKECSQTSTISNGEMVAEMYAGLLHGQVYSPDLIDYYKLMGGKLP